MADVPRRTTRASPQFHVIVRYVKVRLACETNDRLGRGIYDIILFIFLWVHNNYSSINNILVAVLVN